ncbi:MAG: hypothetical protein KKG59_04950 [Nanoarchaeota archaeon]|nr:hypothetical protein [Nanoarchaeota archaeon]
MRWVLVILGILLIVSCTPNKEECLRPYMETSKGCCLDVDSNHICDYKEILNQTEEVNQTGPVNGTGPVTALKPGELPDRSFRMEELESLINNVDGIHNYFVTDNRNIPYLNELEGEIKVNNRAMRTWAIEMLSEELETISDFHEYVAIPTWQGWRYYLNETDWGMTHEYLTENEFYTLFPKNKYYDNYFYVDYEKKGHIDLDINEEVVLSAKWNIPRYRRETFIFNQLGKYRGFWDNPVVVYKLPCTKDTIVYYRPRWATEFGNAKFTVNNKDNAYAMWFSEMRSEEPESLLKAIEVMKFCGVSPELTQQLDMANYSSIEKRSSDMDVFFRTVLDHEFEASVKYEIPDADNAVIIKGYDFSFVQNQAKDTLFEDSSFLKVDIFLVKYPSYTNELYDTIYLGRGFESGKLYSKELVKNVDLYGRDLSMMFLPKFETSYNSYYIGDPVVVALG